MAPQPLRMDQKFRHHHQQRSDPDEPDGIRVCCCRLFTCISVHAITRPAGLLKIVQLLLGSLCQTLLLQYGQSDATYIGRAYTGFAETVATSTTVAFVLLVCSVLSSRTYRAVRQSLFEVLFNVLACAGYMSAASYMAWTTMVWLYPRFLTTRGYMGYPMMTVVYYAGYLAGFVHGADALGAYRAYRDASR